MDDEAPVVVHLQALAHFGTPNVVPACWRTHMVMTEGGPAEVFGEGWKGGQPVHVTVAATLVTCAACRGMIQ